MKKYLIHFMSIDMPTVDDDGVSDGTNFGIYEKTFNTKEEAEKGLEELIAGDKADLESCYGFDEEDEKYEPTVEIYVEDGRYDRKELVVVDKYDATEINTTVYEIVEMEF